MPDMATGDESAPPRPALPRLHSTLAPTRSRPEEIELDGIVPEAHHFAGGSSHDPLVWISPNGTEVPLPEVPALRFGGADGTLVIARFTAPNEDVVLDTVPAHDFGVQVGGWERGAQAGGCDEGTQTQTASEACQTDASPRASPRVVVRKKAAPPAQPSKAPPIEPPPRPKRGINWYHQTNRGPPGHQQGHYMRWM